MLIISIRALIKQAAVSKRWACLLSNGRLGVGVGGAWFTESVERGRVRGVGEGGLLLARQREALSALKHP